MWFRRIPFTKNLKISVSLHTHHKFSCPIASHLSPPSNHRGLSRKKKSHRKHNNDELSYCSNLRVLTVKDAHDPRSFSPIILSAPRENFRDIKVATIQQQRIIIYRRRMAWIHDFPVHLLLYCTTYPLFEAFITEAFPFQCHLVGFWCFNVTQPGAKRRESCMGLFYCEFFKVLILMVLAGGGGCVGLFYCEYSMVLIRMVYTRVRWLCGPLLL